MRERLALAALVLALAGLNGCAALMPVTSPPVAPPAATSGGPDVPVPTPVPVPAARVIPPPAASLDSTTVSDAGRAVLGAIPEPLSPGERVPAPTRAELLATPQGVSMPAPEAAYDTLRHTIAPSDSAAADVPVPTPTQPLGDRPGTLQRLLAPDSSASAPPPPATASTAPAPPAPARPAPAPATPPSPATSGECWRVQVGAPAERARAEGLRQAAESQLMVPFVVEREKGLYKVRTQACLGGDAADSLKRRATLAGFNGVFRFVGGAR